MGVEPNGRRARRGDWPRTETIRPALALRPYSSHMVWGHRCVRQSTAWVQAYLRIARAPLRLHIEYSGVLLENHIRISPHEEVTSGFSRHALGQVPVTNLTMDQLIYW